MKTSCGTSRTCRTRFGIASLFLFAVLMGVGQILLLPPFEGIDEIGHYSMMRQIAAEGRLPPAPEAFFDKAATDYRAAAPFPYAAGAPFEDNKGLTYPSFFADPKAVAAYAPRYREAGSNPAFARSAERNWQSQHPPLYYALMAPVVAATQDLSFVGQFFVLRAVSYAMALAGMLIGLWGTLRFLRQRWEKQPLLLAAAQVAYPGGRRREDRIKDPDDSAALYPCAASFFGPQMRRRVWGAFLFYPLFALQFFPEFARLGNDSLCLLILGCLWPLLLWETTDEGPFASEARSGIEETNGMPASAGMTTEGGRGAFPKTASPQRKLGSHFLFSNKMVRLLIFVRQSSFTRAWAIGLLLGLGLLTKAFFLAATGGLFAFWLYRLWLARGDKVLLASRWDRLVVIAGPVILALLWYFYRWKAHGSFVGAPEYALIEQRGGVWFNLLHKTSLKDLLSDLYQIPAGFVWGGTASQGRMALGLLLPFVGLFALLLGFYLRRLKGTKPSSFFWLPVWIVAPVLAGLCQHVFLYVAFRDLGGTPGWYLHLFLPVLAFVAALGAEALPRFAFRLLGGLAVLFHLGLLWSHLALWAGLATQNAAKIPVFSSFPFDLSRWAEILDRLSVIVWPWLGGGFVLASLLALLGGTILWGFAETDAEKATSKRG